MGEQYYPKTLYVEVHEEGEDDEFLLCTGDVEEIAELGVRKSVAVYKFVNMVTIQGKVEIEE